MNNMSETATKLEDERDDPNEWLEQITCDLGIRQHLDYELLKENGEYKKSASPSWYPSDLGKDLYTRYIKRKGVEGLPFDARTLRKFEIGKLWEAKLHLVLDARIARGEGNMLEVDLNPEAENEAFKKRVENNELELRGFYDRMLLVNDPKMGWIIVVYEIKSVASRSFHHQKKEGEQPLGNRMQMMFYLERIFINKENWNKLVKFCQDKYQITPVKAVGVLSQVSKDDGSMWERTYEFDPALYARIEQEIVTLNDYWVRGVEPPKPTVLLIENGIARLNWEVSYSSYVHCILGADYVAKLKRAEQLVRRHAYYRKSNPTKVGSVEEEIRLFNESCK